ncbi:hypothetical protein KSP39_PZI006675 [Platanthera zijinensis]|uniref:Uncharacterized protein n=1 Tax=Platanthera zijinensis TaxID=2320716 RepID=A0AAP0BRJ8_9ASPA
MKPPSLLSLTVDSALLHIACFTDLSAVPDLILVELFLKTLSAGRLTEKVLKLFVATGNEQILLFVESLNIKQILTPILPTSKLLLRTDIISSEILSSSRLLLSGCSEKF